MLAQPITTREARALAGRFVRNPAVIRALGGERDANILIADDRGDRFVLKVSAPGATLDELLFEASVLDRLAHADAALPVPHVVRAGDAAVVDAGGGRHARMVTVCPGTPLPQHPPASTLRELGAVLARVDVALAGWRHPPLPSRDLQWDLRGVGRYRSLLDEVDERAPVEQAIARYEREAASALAALPAQVLHNDANPSNVLVDDHAHVTALIDFGDVVNAPAAQDLATACAYHVGDGDDPLHDAAEVVAGFRAHRSLTDAEYGVLPALMGARNALTVLVGTDNARRAPGNGAYLTRNAAAAWAGLRAMAHVTSHEAADRLSGAPARDEPAQSKRKRMT